MHCDTTDPNLLEEIRDTGNQSAWDRFHGLYRPRILRHCLKVGLSLDQSEDVIQECFVKCFRYLPKLEYEPAVGRFRAWLNLQVNQQIAEHFRQTSRHVRATAAYSLLLKTFVRTYHDPTSDPSQFDRQLVAMALERTRLDVNPVHWQLFDAHVLQELKSAEVARQFGLSPVAVRVACMRVRKALRCHWKEMTDAPF